MGKQNKYIILAFIKYHYELTVYMEKNETYLILLFSNFIIIMKVHSL